LAGGVARSLKPELRRAQS